MTRICLSSLLALSLFGCTARAIDFEETSASTANDGDDQGTATAGTSATSTGMPTPPTTTSGTTGPDPTDTGPDPSTTDPTDSGPWVDVQPPDPWPIPPDVCAENWGPGTWVQGVAPWGDYFGNRAWNAMVNPWQPGQLKIVILGKNADVAVNLEEAAQNGGMPQTGPALVIDTPFPFPDWLQTAEVPVMMIDGGFVDFALVRIDVYEQLGNWDMWAPDDPPRVRGQIAWIEGEPFGFEGQFDAAYCGYFHEILIGE